MNELQPRLEDGQLLSERLYRGWVNATDEIGRLLVEAAVSFEAGLQSISDRFGMYLDSTGELIYPHYVSAEERCRRLSSKKSVKLAALATSAVVLSSVANTDIEGTPVPCLSHPTPAISPLALDPSQPEDPETGLHLHEELQDRPTSDKEFDDDHSGDATPTNNPERSFNPVRGIETVGTLLGLDTVHEARLPRSGLIVRVHTTEDWLVDMATIEEFLFSGVENAEFIPHPTIRKVIDCYSYRALEQGVLEDKVWNIYLTPQPSDCFEDLGIRPKEEAECDASGLAIPQVYFVGNTITFGNTHILVATSTSKTDTSSINKKLQNSIAFHEVIHPNQTRASKPLLPWSDMEDEAYEVERTLGKARNIPGFPDVPNVFFYVPTMGDSELQELTEAWRNGRYDFGEIKVEELALAN